MYCVGSNQLLRPPRSALHLTVNARAAAEPATTLVHPPLAITGLGEAVLMVRLPACPAAALNARVL